MSQPLCVKFLLLRKPCCYLPPHFATLDNPTSIFRPQFRSLFFLESLCKLPTMYWVCVRPWAPLNCVPISHSSLCCLCLHKEVPEPPCPVAFSGPLRPAAQSTLVGSSWRSHCEKQQFRFFCQDFLVTLNSEVVFGNSLVLGVNVIEIYGIQFQRINKNSEKYLGENYI